MGFKNSLSKIINMKKLSIILLIIVASFVNAQDKEQARKDLKILTSDEFHGRGYCCNGDKIAAKFLAEQMKLSGIKSFSKGYYQKFRFPINTFPNKIDLSIDDKELKLGDDYLVQVISGSLEGEFDIVEFDLLRKDYTDKFVVLDTKKIKGLSKKKIMKIEYLNSLNAKGIIEIIDGNLTQVQSQKEVNHIWVQITRESYNENAKKINISVKNKFYKAYQSQNVVGFVQGEVDTFIVFSAHYDHLGRVGETAVFRGANDNGSGDVLTLNLMRYYAKLENKPHYSMAFMFFTGEEVGLLGSKYYSENPLFPLKKIKFLINLDMVGSGENGITIVNGKQFEKEIGILQKINEEKNYLSRIKLRGEAANSDHYFFYYNNVRSIFIYTEGDYKEYHNIYDIEESLLLTEYDDLFKLLTEFVKEY
jgi:hypothetical protein